MRFFSRYAFLEPPLVNKHGVVLGAEDDDDAKLMEKVVEKQLWKFFKGKQPKLKEVAQENIKASLIRHLHHDEQAAKAQAYGGTSAKGEGRNSYGNGDGTNLEEDSRKGASVLLPNLTPDNVDDLEDIEQILAS